ncbi:MAG: tripartite tricarboxylate transporter substrate-binding protein [Defluviitaleaceae bacterium]|nr:tripartite tricarboxylate transporter substrate-binding protein [Defluviitaleaceae bacterium]
MKKRVVYFNIAVAAVIFAAVAIFFLRQRNDETKLDIPENLTLVVAWNPHSTADEMLRALPFDTRFAVQNISGANGANGKNAVFSAPHNGENILATSLIPFATAQSSGFGVSSRDEWVGWLCAFSPAIVAVAADSPFGTMRDLTDALRSRNLTCANSGAGTASFFAAVLLQKNFDFENISHAGSSPAINALKNREADFAVLLSVEAVIALRSGELRALAAFTEKDFAMENIPSISHAIDENHLPFGEYFGLFIPENVSRARLDGLEFLFQNAAASERFENFIREKGLAPETPDKIQNAALINHIYKLIE